ncbi:hypothetical protein ACKI1K_46530, partial [Streptomyces scabiei]|uniref:hypothetical protein n=1 Tax=Streptomyces scabiei TaxID=1930 RepID=UPI0038F7B694
WAFPYARKTPVNIDALKKQLGGVPLGARIDSLSINSHTVQRLSFVQTDSRPGSPAWYEDLQLTPNRSLEANEFWFVV